MAVISFHSARQAARPLRWKRSTRSCIVTGRNHHSNGLACITEFATGYPGYDGIMPFENGFLSEMLLEHGYSTFMVGKYHLTPSHHETAVGPYDRWPLGRGFERYYGFLGGDTSQWNPDLVYDNHAVEPPRTPEEGYHLTEDLVDKAVEFIADAMQVDPDKPFYLHFCTGAPHSPHHVATEWADKYKGEFDDGWDAYREKVFASQMELGIVPEGAELSRHDPDVPEWESLSADARRLYSRMMEVFAGFLSHADHHIGRLLSFLGAIGEFENTLIMVVSDNGASAEGGVAGTTNEAQFFNNAAEPLEESLRAIDRIGGPTTFNHYPWGWTLAGNTPFRRWKRETYRGGTSDRFIVHWPAGIKARGEVRDQYAHLIDMVPTVLDLLGIQPPATIRGVTQAPLEGVSFAHALADPKAASNHHTRQTCYRIFFANLAILKTVPMDDPELLTVSQAAEAFNATSQTIRNWIRSKRVRAVRIGNRFFIPRDEIERLRGDLSSQRRESPWEFSADQPAEPLRRKATVREPGTDPTEGLLGA